MNNMFAMGDLVPLITQQAQAAGVDPQIALAHFVAENTSDGVMDPRRGVSLDTLGIDPQSGKPSGAKGLFQVVGTTLESLRSQGKIPKDLDYSTLQGQIIAGIAAVKDAHTQDNGDPMRGASLYANGSAGLNAYNTGNISSIPQLANYLPKMGRSMGVSVRTKVGDPAAMDSMSTAMTAFQSQADQSKAMLNAMIGTFQSATDQGIEGIKATAAAKAGEANAAASRETDLNNRDNALLDMFGINTNGNNAQIFDLNSKMSAYGNVVDELKPQVDALHAINPVTDPVGWLAAQFQLGSLVPKYNAAVQNRDSAATQIQVRQGLEAKQRDLTPAATQDTINLEKNSKVALAAAQAQVQISGLQKENLGQQMRVQDALLGAAGTTAQLAMARARMMMESVGYSSAEKAGSAEAANLANMNAFRLKMGLQPLQSMQELSKLPPEERELLVNVAADGIDPGKAIAFVAHAGSLPTLKRSSGGSTMADTISSITADAKPAYDLYKQAHPNAKETDAIISSVNTTVTGYRNEIKDDMLKGKPTNPYRMKAALYAMAPELTDNKFAQYVKGPGGQLPELGERQLMDYAIGRVNAGEDVGAVSKELAQFMRIGGQRQNMLTGIATLGFDLRTQTRKGQISPEISYPISSDIYNPGLVDALFGSSPIRGISGPKQNVQMLDETSLKNFITYIVSKQKDIPPVEVMANPMGVN